MRNPIFVLFVLSAAAAIAAGQPDLGYDYFGRVRDKTQIVTNAEQAAATALATKADATNTYTKAETDAAIARLAPVTDLTTNNTTLVGTIEATAPAPGDYANVSSKAVNALSRDEARNGYTEWKYSGIPQGYSIYEPLNYSAGEWEFTLTTPTGTHLNFHSAKDENATSIDMTSSGVSVTATRTHLPTMADIPTNNVQLINGAGYVTKSITNGLAGTSGVNAAVSNKADAVRAVAGGQVVVSCSWWDGSKVLTWNGAAWIWNSGRLGGVRQLTYENGWWEYMPTTLPYGYTNSVPIYGLPPSLVLYLDDESVTLVRTNEVYATATNEYPVAYMDQVFAVSNLAESAVHEESDPTVPSWAKGTTKPSYSASEVGAYPNTSGEQLSAQVSAIGTYLNAEDARFVSTNYDSAVRTPEAYVEVRLNDNGTNVWTTIWREMTRWGKFVGSAFDWDTWAGFHAWATNITAELSHKADRCWGIYDSETGGYSPEGYTQISSSNILIAAGMAYQRTVTTDGSVWVLQCNQGTAHIGGDTNGFFRVVDGDGVTQFEIIKGDRREMGADASGITVGANNVMTIPYSVEAAEHPTIRCCSNLATANWKDETDTDCLCTVTWSGSSGAWVATVAPKTPQPSMFVKASYMAGGETYIRNVAPVDMDSIMLNGTKYYLGTATIDGHTVLTLSTTPIVQ